MNQTSSSGSKSRLLFVFLILFSASAFANVTISLHGTFASNAPTRTYSAPNASWTLSFQLGNPPSVFGVQATSFDSTPINAVYTLNGTPIPVTGTEVFFSDTVMNIFLTEAPVQFFVNTATPFFTGTFANPTLVPNSYPVTNVAVIYDDGTVFADSTSSNLLIAQSAPPSTPVPSSVLMVSIGLAALALVEMLRRRHAAA